MQKITVLPPDQAQKIAAGEVIERPANIVKELLENSIDAGAKTITVTIEKAGKKLIRITDDGCGMSESDALLCFSRHATSKLTTVDDLMSLTTFGFRGEALASIAAVSHVTLTTLEQGSSQRLGTRIVFDHGTHSQTESVATSAGTTIEVADLFATIPVRKTFLKQDETEWNQIMAVINGIVLMHQNITLKVFKDGALTLNAPAVTTLRDRITQLWGHNLAAQLTSISTDTGAAVSLSGLISLPPFARYGRQQLIFFVNNRLVKNTDISKAILKGYKQALPPGKYPAACLFITTNPEHVDVNIHPRKEEVRFTKPGVVTRIIQEAITRGLEQTVTDKLSTPSTQPYHPRQAETIILQSPLPPLPEPFTPPMSQPLREPAVRLPQQLTATPPKSEQPSPQTITQQTTTPALDENIRIVGQFFNTYIVVEKEHELIIVDQHAAHERILYHQFAHKFTAKEGTQLLFPETITLTEKAVTLLVAHESFFADQGIGFHQAGPTHIAITSTPPKLQKESLADLLKDAADFIITHESLDHEVFMRKLNEHVHSHMACKAAVRAGDILDTDTMRSLVEQLMRTPDRFMCVHGRPTMWPISQAEVEKSFAAASLKADTATFTYCIFFDTIKF